MDDYESDVWLSDDGGGVHSANRAPFISESSKVVKKKLDLTNLGLTVRGPVVYCVDLSPHDS